MKFIQRYAASGTTARRPGSGFLEFPSRYTPPLLHTKHPPRGKRPQTHAPPTKAKPACSEQTRKTCGRCGRGSNPRDKCPAKDAVCHKCEKKGHYGSQCFSKRVSEVTGTSGSRSQLDAAFLDTVTSDRSSAWYTTIGVNKHSITFKLDTGDEVTAISSKTYQTLQSPPLSPPRKLLYVPSRQPLKTVGQFQAEISNKEKSERQLIYVCGERP